MCSKTVYFVVAAALLLLGQAVDAANMRRELMSDKPEKAEKLPSCKDNCNGVCVNKNTDPNNCGTCSNKCPEGWKCKDGNCFCPQGFFVCPEGTCVPNAKKCNTTCVEPPPPQPVLECTCRRTLTPVPLNTSNGCQANLECGFPNRGALCNTPEDAGFCTCGAACGNFAFCSFPQGRANDGGALCYETCCDRNGTVNIQGASVRNCSTFAACEAALQPGARCGPSNDLFLYTGPSTIRGADSTELVTNQASVDFTDTCTVGQCFQLCEDDGVILTDTVQSSLTITAYGECPADYEQVGECTPVGCDTNGEVPDAVCVVLDTPDTPEDPETPGDDD